MPTLLRQEYGVGGVGVAYKNGAIESGGSHLAPHALIPVVSVFSSLQNINSYSSTGRVVRSILDLAYLTLLRTFIFLSQCGCMET